MKADLVSERTPYSFKIMFVILLISLKLTAFGEYKVFYFVIVLFLFSIIAYPYGIKYRKSGTAEFFDDCITIITSPASQETISLNPRTILELTYDIQHAKKLKAISFTVGMLTKVRIESPEGLIRIFPIIIRKKQRDGFTAILDILYRKGVQIKERDQLGTKCFLLRGNLSYNEIQQIKKDYDLTW